jgi:hypothetical protein
MSEQASRITISRSMGQQNYFDVVVEEKCYGGELAFEDGLLFDEMLGVVARLMIPTNGDGAPNRQVRKPLFLQRPKKEVA